MNPSAAKLTRISAVVSGLLALGLGGAALRFRSELALAQAADSLLDFAAAILLAWVVVVAQAPEDEKHPVGHARAEPLGALVIAALAGVLALEVGSSAVDALLGSKDALLSSWLLSLFATKMAFKALILRFSLRGTGPAFRALSVDARNDLIVCALSSLGFLGAKLGAPRLDAALAIPAACWIGWSGVDLARENVDLLLGVAPPPERSAQLLVIAASAPGIIEAHDLVAHSTGTALSVHVHITVDESLTVRQGHDLGERVRSLLLAEDDVAHCSVHVDPSG